MPAVFRPTTPDDLPRIQGLLQHAFGIEPDRPTLNSALLNWKYWQPGTSRQGGRGYVLEQDGALLAHGSLWPVGMDGVAACDLLDWAAVKRPPGMGVALVRRLAEIVPVLVSTGGSPDTRAIMPRIGFRHIANQAIYVRILRAMKQHRTRPHEPPQRSLPRLARNFAWSLAPPVPLRGWTARRATELPDAAANHLLSCPAATVTAWTLEHPGGVRGSLVLSRVGGQMRIARMRLDTNTRAGLEAAYAVACRTALEDAEACELAALSSSAAITEALEANHFHYRESRPVFIYDPKRLIAPSRTLEFDMLDDDMAYLNVPEYPYFA